MPAQPVQRSRTTKFLLYADPGWGKTPMLADAKGKKLILRPPVEHIDALSASAIASCEEWVLNNWNDMDEAYEELRLKPKRWKDWVLLDSVSGYQDIGLDDIWEFTIEKNERRKDYGLDKGEYGINMQRLGRYIRYLVRLADEGKFNLAVTAWPADPAFHGSMATSEDDERPDKLMPWIQGKNMSTKICGYMNLIGYGTFTEKGNRVIYFEETERYIAKDAITSAGAFRPNGGKLIKPTMSQIEQAIDSARNKVAPKRPKKATTIKRSRRSST